MLINETLDGSGWPCYTINNKRKRAEGRDYIKLETTPALLYLKINNKKLWPRV
jgi:hypothetical protein